MTIYISFPDVILVLYLLADKCGFFGISASNEKIVTYEKYVLNREFVTGVVFIFFNSLRDNQTIVSNLKKQHGHKYVNLFKKRFYDLKELRKIIIYLTIQIDESEAMTHRFFSISNLDEIIDIQIAESKKFFQTIYHSYS